MARDEEQVLDELQRMQRRMDRLFNEMLPTMRWLGTGTPQTWRPPTDVYETEESVIVKVEVAGMSDQDFVISLSNRSLSITGMRRDPDYKLAYQQLEIPYGHFCTEVFLPYTVDHDGIGARYENGFLTVTLPKVRVHRIQVVERTADDRSVNE